MNYTEPATAVTQQLVTHIETGPGTWRTRWHIVTGLLDFRNTATCYLQSQPRRPRSFWVCREER